MGSGQHLGYKMGIKQYFPPTLKPPKKMRARPLRLEIEATQQIDVSLLCVCPVIDHEFRHNTVKVAAFPQTTLTML